MRLWECPGDPFCVCKSISKNYAKGVRKEKISPENSNDLEKYLHAWKMRKRKDSKINLKLFLTQQVIR